MFKLGVVWLLPKSSLQYWVYIGSFNVLYMLVRISLIEDKITVHITFAEHESKTIFFKNAWTSLALVTLPNEISSERSYSAYSICGEYG